jgi:hypothetical protein
MRDEENPRVHIFFERIEKREDLFLNRHIEGSGRFVRVDEARLQRHHGVQS